MNSNPSFLGSSPKRDYLGDARRRPSSPAIFPTQIRARREQLPFRSHCPSSDSRDGTPFRNPPRRVYRPRAEARRSRRNRHCGYRTAPNTEHHGSLSLDFGVKLLADLGFAEFTARSNERRDGGIAQQFHPEGQILNLP